MIKKILVFNHNRKPLHKIVRLWIILGIVAWAIVIGFAHLVVAAYSWIF